MSWFHRFVALNGEFRFGSVVVVGAVPTLSLVADVVVEVVGAVAAEDIYSEITWYYGWQLFYKEHIIGI